jgi:hypothetical protein
MVKERTFSNPGDLAVGDSIWWTEARAWADVGDGH